MKWIKTYWLILAMVVFLLILPLQINLCYRLESDCSELHAPSAWATFWATYLAAIASFAMVFITWLTLKKNKEQNDAILQQNKDQLNEMKRQWEEDHRPKIEAYLIKGSTIADKREIEFVNIGASPAEDIIFHLDSQFIDGAPIEEIAKDVLRKLGNATPAFLFPHETQSFSIYEKEYVPNAWKYGQIYTIAGVPVDEAEFRAFVGYVSQYGEISIKGDYNGRYDIDTSVNANRTRYPYSSISKSIDRVSDNIIRLNFSMSEHGVKIKEEKKDK